MSLSLSGRKALVLGGGGLTGIAWITGMMLGLARAGVRLAGFDMILGTSAGAAAGAQFAQGALLDELYRRQTEPALQGAEIAPAPGLMEALRAEVARHADVTDPVERMRRVGKYALAVSMVSEAERLAVIAGRLDGPEWPDQPLGLVAVDAESGETVVFTRGSGATLTEAVAASCAVPGVWPPARIAGRRYIDGGVRSPENLDLLVGFKRVLVISPKGDTPGIFVAGSLRAEIAAVEAAGGVIHVIAPDDAAREAMGANSLDPDVRIPSARAGLRQAANEADGAARFLGG